MHQSGEQAFASAGWLMGSLNSAPHQKPNSTASESLYVCSLSLSFLQSKCWKWGRLHRNTTDQTGCPSNNNQSQRRHLHLLSSFTKGEQVVVPASSSREVTNREKGRGSFGPHSADTVFSMGRSTNWAWCFATESGDLKTTLGIEQNTWCEEVPKSFLLDKLNGRTI